MSSNKELMQRRSQAIPVALGKFTRFSLTARKTAGCGTLKAVS